MGLRQWWKSLVGGAQPELGNAIIDAKRRRALSMTSGTSDTGWQADAAMMYDLVPELRYGISWIASSASRSSLIVARTPDHPAASPIPVDEDARESAPLYELAPTQPEQSVLIERITTLLKLVGEWGLVGYDDDYGGRRWVVVSPQHVTTSSGDIHFSCPDTGTKLKYPLSPADGGAWYLRFWKPHPVYPLQPDSPTRALIDTLHELIDLSGHVQTSAKSRLAGAGILLVPSSLSSIAPGQANSPNPSTGAGIMRALVRSAQTALKSPNDVSRHLPVMVQGPEQALQYVRHLPLDTPFAERVDELRMSAVRRVAIGLDIPPEVLSGMGDLNHWTAWQVDSAGQKINVAPTLAFICRELTRKYLRPALHAMGVSNPESYMIWYDDTALENNPNSAEVAIEAYNIGLISPDAARDTLGYGPADAPPPGWVPPVMRVPRVNGNPMRTPNVTMYGPASGDETKIAIPASGNGWIACADIAARRALTVIGQRLITSGGRSLRGKYRDVPMHDMHTRITPGNTDVLDNAMTTALADITASAPALTPVIAAYTRDRVMSGKPHDLDVLTTYLMKEDASCQ